MKRERQKVPESRFEIEIGRDKIYGSNHPWAGMLQADGLIDIVGNVKLLGCLLSETHLCMEGVISKC